jgi:hypothetical protein
METIDLKKELKRFYTAKTRPEIIDVPEGRFLAFDGRGEPGGEEYTTALNALYGVAYTLKFGLKKRGVADFTVMGLEGLWWWDDPTIVWLEDAPPRETWNWKSMIRMPDLVTEEMAEAAKAEVRGKRGPAADRVKLEPLNEGLSAQILHVGPYSDEPRSQKTLHAFIEELGYGLRGRHHEIYMGDPRRTAPERLKTILRHPVEKR